MRLDWTEAGRIDGLKALAAKGYSSAVIASELGVTRNVVIGAAARHGVKLGYMGRRPRAPQIQKHRTGLSFRADRKIPTSKPVIPMAPEPDARNLTVLELKRNDCRWPVTADSPYLFCGHPKADGSSYCAHHNNIAVKVR